MAFISGVNIVNRFPPAPSPHTPVSHHTHIQPMDYLYSMIPHSVMTLVGVEVEAIPSADLFLLAAVQETIPKLLSYQLHESLPEVRPQ